jgi:hypothetical protein
MAFCFSLRLVPSASPSPWIFFNPILREASVYSGVLIDKGHTMKRLLQFLCVFLLAGPVLAAGRLADVEIS